MGEGNVLVADDKGMAKVLNKNFANVFTVENLAVVPQASKMTPAGNNIVLQEVNISATDILRVVTKLQENEAAGVDGIFSTFIKKSIMGLLETSISNI